RFLFADGFCFRNRGDADHYSAFVILHLARARLARISSLVIRALLHQRSFLATICCPRKCTRPRFIARKQEPRSQRARSAVVSAADVACCVYRLNLVCVCAGNNAWPGVVDAEPLFSRADYLAGSASSHSGADSRLKVANV